MALRGRSLDLLNGLLDTPEGQRDHRQQAVRVRARPIDEEIVVGPNALEHQRRLLEPQKAPRPEAAEIGIEDHRVDALLVHQLQSRMRVVGRLRDVVVAHRNVRIGVMVSRHRVEAGPAGGLIADEPHVATVDSADVGNLVAPLARDARGPDFRRLGDVGVDVDHLVTIEELSGHASSTPIVSAPRSLLARFDTRTIAAAQGPANGRK